MTTSVIAPITLLWSASLRECQEEIVCCFAPLPVFLESRADGTDVVVVIVVVVVVVVVVVLLLLLLLWWW